MDIILPIRIHFGSVVWGITNFICLFLWLQTGTEMTYSKVGLQINAAPVPLYVLSLLQACKFCWNQRLLELLWILLLFS